MPVSSFRWIPTRRGGQLVSRTGKARQITDIGDDRRQPIGDDIAMRQTVVAAEHDDRLLNACAAQLDAFFDQGNSKAPDLFSSARAQATAPCP